jgi:hypothetical protein
VGVGVEFVELSEAAQRAIQQEVSAMRRENGDGH